MTTSRDNTNRTARPASRRARALGLALAMCFALLVVPGAASAFDGTDTTGVFSSPDLGGSTLASTATASATGATISSDKADYAPGAWVYLTGSGWAPGESVRIVVDDDGLSEQAWQRDVTVTADDAGNISDEFELAPWFVADYTVTATGEQSGTATTTFTDAIAATANVDRTDAYRNRTGVVFTFTVTNTSTAGESIGAARITSPNSAYQFTACGSGAGWTTTVNAGQCVYNSNGSNLIPVGGSSTFTVTATITAGDNALNTSGNNSWDDKIRVAPGPTYVNNQANNATPTAAGQLAANAYAFEVTDAVVATSGSAIGSACPPPSKTAPAGAERVIVICGRPGTTQANVTPLSANSSLGGTMIGTAGTFKSASIPGSIASPIVLANYGAPNPDSRTLITSAAGSDKTVDARIGSSGTRTSPLTTFSGYDSRHGTALAVDPATGTFAGTTTLSAMLTRTTDNAAVSGKSISFKLDGDSVGSATTNASGVATLTGVSLAGIDAGTYPGAVEASFTTDSTHTGSSGSANLTVNRADTTTTVTCGAGPFTYNGLAQTPCSAQVTGPGGLDEALSVDYSDNTDAGTATASASYAQTVNYNASSDSKTFDIDKADPAVSITWADTSYDGDPHPASASVSGVGSPAQDLGAADSLTYFEGPDTTGTELAGAPTDAGTYTVRADFDGNDNYNPASATKTIVISPADTETTVTCVAGPFTFDGSAQTPCSAQVTGPGSLDQTLTVDYSDNTDAGTATASASYAGTANYNPSSDSKNFEIGQAATTTETTCTAGPFTFSGSAHTPCSAKVTGPAGLDQTLTVDYTDNTNAGTATASASYAGGGNYKSSSDSKQFDIGKATTSTALSCPASVTHTGSPLEPCSAIVTGPAGLNQGVTVSYTDNTNVGTASAIASYAGTANYKPSSDSKTFTITTACRTASTFQAPIKDGTRMVVKLGNVIPVKLRLADCHDVLVTGRTLSIRVIAGIVNGDDVVEGSEILPPSVSAADSTGIMRLVDGNHMYNLGTKGLGTGLPYTIVIRDTTTAAWSSAPTVGTAVIEPKK